MRHSIKKELWIKDLIQDKLHDHKFLRINENRTNNIKMRLERLFSIYMIS